jgi:hypothetical protein
MLSPEILDQEEFAFTQGDFVGINLAETSPGKYNLHYNFELYVNVHLCLIKQFDEIEARVTEKSNTKSSYFTSDSTPDGVLDSVTGFMQRSRTVLTEERKKIQIGSTIVKVSQFLDDLSVAKIGSGRINEENYELFLPQIDYLSAGSQAPGPDKSYDTSLVSRIASDLFTTFSYHPAEIFKRENSLQGSPAGSRVLDLITNLRVTESSEPNLQIKNAKQQYRLCRFRVDILDITESKLLEIVSKRNLYLELAFFRKKVIKLKTSFLFQNRSEIENSGARLKDLRLQVIQNPDARGADQIRVVNTNSFDVRYQVEQHAYVNQTYTISKVASGILRSKSSVRVIAKTDFGNPTDSRAYTVLGARDLPFTVNNCRIMSCVSVLSARKVARESVKLEAYAEQLEDAILIVTKNVPDFVDSVLLTRKQKGYPDSLGSVIGSFEPNTSITDDEVVLDTDYIYSIRFFSSGARVLELIQVPFTIKSEELTVNIDFSVELESALASSGQIQHRIKIDETRTETTAATLQREIVSSGMSDKFDAEREDNKSQYSLTTRYKISRVNLTTGQSETLPGLYSPGSIDLAFAGDATHGFRYLVRLLKANTAAVSYLTVVTQEDVNTGNSYKFRFRKWRSASTKRNESLPSQQQIVKNSLDDGVETAGVGKQVALEVSPSFVSPTITDLDVTRDDVNNCNYISWNATGSTSEIDHFLILGSYNDSEKVIGTGSASKFDESKPYVYVDRDLADKIGEVSYRIIVVERGLRFSLPSSPVATEVSTSIPERSLLIGKT